MDALEVAGYQSVRIEERLRTFPCGTNPRATGYKATRHVCVPRPKSPSKSNSETASPYLDLIRIMFNTIHENGPEYVWENLAW
jgi:hypothetical protein